MIHSKKILYNTIAVYIKIILNSVATLIATRIVLQCLGVNDFGLYNLLAGVITMLSFMNGALMVSTQRYLSIAIGAKDYGRLSSIFNSSLSIHGLIAVVVSLAFLLLQPIIIDCILTIPQGSVRTAHLIYDVMIISSVLTLLQVPFSAAMNAHEDIWYWAFTEFVNCALRLASAVALIYITDNKLFVYTIMVLFSLVMSMLLKVCWCRIKYAETKLKFAEMKNIALIKEMFGFVGWNTLGTSGTMVRDQGVAVLMNVFFGTIANAAYGIAQQINGLVMTFASTITTVFAPSIMQAHGAGDDEKMIKLAIFSSKISFLLSSIIALPLLLFMPEILRLWLEEIPIYTLDFCRYVIIVFMILQLTAGLNRAIYAVGKIKWYQIIIFSVLVAIIPVSYMLYKSGMTINVIFYVMIFAQVILTIANVSIIREYVEFDIIVFYGRSIILPIILCASIIYVFHIIISMYLNGLSIFSIVIVSIIVCITYLLIYLVLVFNKKELKQIKSLIRK